MDGRISEFEFDIEFNFAHVNYIISFLLISIYYYYYYVKKIILPNWGRNLEFEGNKRKRDFIEKIKMKFYVCSRT